MPNSKMVFQIASVYTAVVVGAGFATGRELASFFLRFGDNALGGLMLSGTIMTLVGWATLDISFRNNVASFDSLLNYIAGPYLGAFMKIGCMAMLFTFFVAMLSATGALGAQLLGVPTIVGSSVMVLMCFVALMHNLDGLLRINTYLAPILIVGSVLIGLYTYTAVTPVFAPSIREILLPNSWESAAVLYASYNMVGVVGMLSSMGSGVKRQSTAVLGVLLGAGAVTIIALSMSLGLWRGYASVQSHPVPFLALLQGEALVLVVYVVVLLIAIYTTALSNAYCFHAQLVGKGTTASKVIVCALALLFSQIGFTTIVEIVYPAFGLLGMFLGILLLFTLIFKRRS